jgi:hypothetical protein
LAYFNKREEILFTKQWRSKSRKLFIHKAFTRSVIYELFNYKSVCQTTTHSTGKSNNEVMLVPGGKKLPLKSIRYFNMVLSDEGFE